MTDIAVSLKDNANPQKYYAVIEHMADDDLGPFEYRLYGHYKRVCGQGGACWEGVRVTAKKCQMSAGKVSQARRGLVEKGYITETVITKDSTVGNPYTVGIAVELTDRWLENVKRYSCDEQGCSPHEQGVHHMKQRKNQEKKEPKPTATNQEQPSIPKEQELKAPTPQEGENVIQDTESSEVNPTPFQALFTAICAEFGYDPAKLTKSRRGMINAAAGELLGAGCTVPEVHYLKLYLDVLKREQEWTSYTPAAMSKYYPDYAAAQALYDRTHPTHMSEPPSGKAFELEAQLVRFALDSGNADLVGVIRRAARGIAPDLEALGGKSNG